MEFDNEKMMFLIETLRRCDMKGTEIHSILIRSWPEHAPSVRRVQQIVKEFQEGTRNSLKRFHGSGRQTSELRNENIPLIEEAIQEDNDMTVRELAVTFDLSESMTYRILTEDLENIWMHTRWVPHVISEHHRQQRVECCTNMMQSFESRITRSNLITIDEKWFYCRKMLPRNVVGSWVGPGGDRRKTAVRSSMEKKFLAIVAVSTRGKHFFQVLDRGETVDSDVYIQFLQGMRNFFANLPQPLLMENIRLIHDNARPHVSNNTREYLNSTAVRLLKQPAYSPDCNLCDRYVFPRLEAIRGRDDFNTKDELTEFLDNQLPLFTQQRMSKALATMTEDFRKIIENDGHYL